MLYKMSVPFSNTNLRIPKGFGNLLEGLAREVLRDQPGDIPTFAALYFTELLKAREGDWDGFLGSWCLIVFDNIWVTHIQYELVIAGLYSMSLSKAEIILFAMANTFIKSI